MSKLLGSGIRMASIPLAQAPTPFSPESGTPPNPGSNPGPTPGVNTGGSGGALVGLLGLIVALGLAAAVRDESAPSAAAPAGDARAAYVLVVTPESSPAGVGRYLHGGLLP